MLILSTSSFSYGGPSPIWRRADCGFLAKTVHEMGTPQFAALVEAGRAAFGPDCSTAAAPRGAQSVHPSCNQTATQMAVSAVGGTLPGSSSRRVLFALANASYDPRQHARQWRATARRTIPLQATRTYCFLACGKVKKEVAHIPQ